MANTHSLRVNPTSATSGGQGITAPASTDFDIRTSNERTFEWYIEPNTISSTPGLLERWTSGQKNLLVRIESDGRISAYPGTGTTTLSAGLAQTTDTISTGVKTHIGVTWNGSVLKVYIDGVLKDTGGSVTPGSSTDLLGLMGSPVNSGSATNFDGWVANIRVWDVERTAAELLANKDVSLTGSETGLLHNWKLDNDYTNDVSGGPSLTPVNSPTFDTRVMQTASSSSAPTVTTQAASSVGETTATLNGNVTADGGATITERGFYYSTSATVTTGDTKVTTAGTTGAYTNALTGLTASTTYYYRAFATNSEGTTLGDSDVSFTTTAAATAPSAFVTGNWTLTDLGTGGDARIAISTLPSDGGSAITDLEYQLDSGSWTSLGGTATGNYDISGLTDGVSTDVKIRAVNAVGNGADSDTKSVTTTAAATAPSAFVSGNWSVADLATTGDARITITTLPSDGGSAITDLEVKIGAAAYTSLSGTTTGTYDISGLTDGVATDILIRAVNGVGNGADSDTKSVTTTATPAATVTPMASGDRVYRLDVSDTTNSAAGEYKATEPTDLQALAPIAEPTLSSDASLVWMANASGTKDGTAYAAGDILVTINSGGTSKTTVIADFSAL